MRFWHNFIIRSFVSVSIAFLCAEEANAVSPPDSKEISWAVMADEKYPYADCTGVPGVHYLFLRHHQEGGSIHGYWQEASTQITIAMEIPSRQEAYDEKPDKFKQYVEGARKYLSDLGANDRQYDLGIEFSLLHPFGSRVSSPNSKTSYARYSVPEQYIPKLYLKTKKYEISDGLVNFSDVESDDLILIDNKIYYTSTFKEDVADKDYLVCMAPLLTIDQLILPLRDIKCYWIK